MSTVDYSQMSDQELKEYFLAHRTDKNAFEAYIDRRHQKLHRPIISKEELNSLSVEQQEELINKRLQLKFGS
ncbi:MAG: hypothetical protein F6J89_07345 [Symploca sp. SIO1C4]|uniref:Uncharacterized protein n=1 Tax=Symploca sp. SIO1C4 TaxID=2607765 RepID=A0A6B3NA13_9CYAN|nr:hypothetical protein [Symploca sp. SIO1C4]NET06469.1 hypothetical protein [Symploca sp. SIO2B6]